MVRVDVDVGDLQPAVREQTARDRRIAFALTKLSRVEVEEPAYLWEEE